MVRYKNLSRTHRNPHPILYAAAHCVDNHRMASLIQDSIAGHAIRFLSKGRVFKYAEERDPSLWKQYTNKEKSSRMAYHGRMDSIGEADGITDGVTPRSSRCSRIESMGRIPSSAWSDRGNRFQGLTGMRINPEEGKDIHLIDWWDDKDQEVWARLRFRCK